MYTSPRVRAEYAEAALNGWRHIRAANEDESDLRDLLADMLHWADQHGVDFWNELRVAQDNYEAEIIEDLDAE